MTSFHRNRIEEEIKKIVSNIIIQELSDPRIGIVTISRVSLTNDLHSAKIFISVLDTEKIDTTTLILNKAKKRIRWFLSKKIKVRRVPELIFYNDKNPYLYEI
ncbi:30S ribosome-binding factor RbfA [candidate division WOR-3 bacterium]|nr:30S ribosome-binding factor RbfA [candidate division WOR-3 bacterium]MCK4575680.1 30S ribosome-binding factor RbfA [candidate division WOR-3 bacterium]